MYKGSASEGNRALQLQNKREKAKEDLEIRKRKIEEELKVSSIDTKFASHYDAIEAQLKSSTVGLVSLSEMKARQETAVKERERQIAQKNAQALQKQLDEKNEEKARQKKQIKALSFNFDEDEVDEDDEDDEPVVKVKIEKRVNEDDEDNEEEKIIKKCKITKNPEVDTSFLPDREREEEENRLREQLRQEWVEKQAKLKNEEIEITFSYWDGSGHRRSVIMKKGSTIYQFLTDALNILRKEFHELKTITADQLMYVKEDLIIPHHYTFYDFIVTKARGKSGPLFSFDVHEDVRLVADATVEKDESHAGKVLTRAWYDRNRHIFPANRWEHYDSQKDYGKYTISDKAK